MRYNIKKDIIDTTGGQVDVLSSKIADSILEISTTISRRKLIIVPFPSNRDEHSTNINCSTLTK